MMPSAEGQQFFQVCVAVVFAAGGFWGREFEIGIAEKLVEKRGNAAALLSEARIFVEAAAPAREARDESIDKHVPRARVEGENLRGLGGYGKNCDIGDTAEVEGDAAEFRVAVEKIVRVGHERRALATESEVRGAKVANRRDAGTRGDDGWLANLKCGSRWRAKTLHGLALMENGLAVTADERDS